jgi:hypothetical protein
MVSAYVIAVFELARPVLAAMASQLHRVYGSLVDVRFIFVVASGRAIRRA